MDKIKSKCCFINSILLHKTLGSGETVRCEKDAEWKIVHGPGYEDYTESCPKHVGYLLTDALEHRIYPM